jgi:hypothetical protein
MPRVTHIRVGRDARAEWRTGNRQYLLLPAGLSLPALRAWWRWT